MRDVEFVQFHPTVLWRGPAARGRQPLVSEAVRGEGAVLVDATGRPVMAGVHPLGDLAPRDVVAAAMHRRMAAAPGGVATHLLLDATGLGRAVLERRFPTVLAACRAAGVDPLTEPIPVAPGAHYACGGATADLCGRTSVPGLFAVGEVASTGVHGANRLASNSLTEALLAGRRAGELLAALTAVGGALLGRWAAGRVVQPLDTVAGAAARIAGGELDTRLAVTEDPDLATIVGSFNSMVDALHERIERDARFTADVSHELRSPLTTLVTAVDVLQRRRADLPDRSQHALDLVARELDRFQRSLEDLLELGRLDAGAAGQSRSTVDLADLVRHTLETSGRPTDLLGADPGICVDVDKRQLARALVNLFDNADRHGDGLTGVRVRADAGSAFVLVDDEGPGVPAADRERIFERFARGGSRRSLPGTGLGLSLVAETVRAHDGTVWCTDRPGGGARFAIRLPRHAEAGTA